MKIRQKIILLVLPVIVATVLLTGAASYFSASAGISRLAREFLGFKVYELQKYALSQWQLLEENGKTEQEEWRLANQASLATYAATLVQSPTQAVFALDLKGKVSLATGELPASPAETAALLAAFAQDADALLTLPVAGRNRVMKGFFFAPYEWYLVVSDLESSFYSDLEEITRRSAIILVVSLISATLFLFFFASTLTRPLVTIIDTMRAVISSGDLSRSVEVEYQDETGELAHTFNIMTQELDKAWKQIKSYAYQAVLAQKKEQKIRRIFQRYVPQEVINSVESNPEAMLVGQDRVISILFSDIRSFTTISESMAPQDLVTSLNQYFSVMVDLIDKRNGIVDKYIGDAIMAFFGAPVSHGNDALQSVLAGLDMTEAIHDFNAAQVRKGRPEFHIGIGINFGPVTVGNIGTEKKMDYTVIGDNVNLASRMEGLTKEYHEPILITQSLFQEVSGDLPCRLMDIVAVKGKTQGVRIYTVRRTLDTREARLWELHNRGMEDYFARDFARARQLFTQAGSEAGQMDQHLERMVQACDEFLHNPPPADWDGTRVMSHK